VRSLGRRGSVSSTSAIEQKENEKVQRARRDVVPPGGALERQGILRQGMACCSWKEKRGHSYLA
jgi:hypothetical protein